VLKFLKWLLQWERKTVAEIVAPLERMKAELVEALEHHTDQAAFHREQEALHNNEAAKAIIVRDNLTKVLGQ
jgi:hypothetical protein